MSVQLEVLDGPNKGKNIRLKSGLTLGRELAQMSFNDSEMEMAHAVVTFDHKNIWNIECLAPNKMRLGFEEVTHASLILGLIFHLGQTGFKVVARLPKQMGPWQDELKDWFESYIARPTATEIFFFLRPVRLSFIQGPQYEEVYTLSYGPRELGYNCLDLNIKDPASPPKVAKFFQIGDRSYIENLCATKATINGAAFDQHVISAGDILRVASSVIELSIL